MNKLRKTYCVDQSELSTIVLVNGRSVRVNFTGGYYSGGCRRRATLTTESEELQKAIENDPRYLKTINVYRVDKIQNVEPKMSKKGNYKVYKLVDNIQDARNILITNHKVDPESLGLSCAEVKNAAENVNVKFPNLR